MCTFETLQQASNLQLDPALQWHQKRNVCLRSNQSTAVVFSGAAELECFVVQKKVLRQIHTSNVWKYFQMLTHTYTETPAKVGLPFAELLITARISINCCVNEITFGPKTEGSGFWLDLPEQYADGGRSSKILGNICKFDYVKYLDNSRTHTHTHGRVTKRRRFLATLGKLLV